jgi:hypothetical protein
MAGIEEIYLLILMFYGFVGVCSRLKVTFYIVSNPKNFQVRLNSFPNVQEATKFLRSVKLQQPSQLFRIRKVKSELTSARKLA